MFDFEGCKVPEVSRMTIRVPSTGFGQRSPCAIATFMRRIAVVLFNRITESEKARHNLPITSCVHGLFPSITKKSFNK